MDSSTVWAMKQSLMQIDDLKWLTWGWGKQGSNQKKPLQAGKQIQQGVDKI